jgi:hypothetical protein
VSHGLDTFFPADLLTRDLLAGEHKDVLRRAYGHDAVDLAADRIVTRARAERAVLLARARDKRPDLAQMCFAAQYRDEQERFHDWLFARCNVTPLERQTVAMAHVRGMVAR